MPARWFFINLERSPERRATIEAQLARLGLSATRIEAIDGNTLSLDHPLIDPAGFWRDAGMQMRTTDAACYISHIKALEVFLETGDAFAVILEDDADLNPATAEVVEALTAPGAPDDWDMVKLTGNSRLRAVTFRPITGPYRLGVHWTRLPSAAAYLVNRVAAQRYVSTMRPMTVLYDHAYDRGWSLGLRTRTVVPLPAEGRFSAHARVSTIDTPDRPRMKNRGLGKATSLWWRTKNEVMRALFAATTLIWPKRVIFGRRS